MSEEKSKWIVTEALNVRECDEPEGCLLHERHFESEQEALDSSMSSYLDWSASFESEVDWREIERSTKIRQRIEQSKLRILEQQHSERGLKFDKGGWGIVPVQIYGEIDGERFYFRVRYNTASLYVGPVNRELDEFLEALESERREANLREHQEAECEGGNCLTCILFEEREKEEFTVEHYYPRQLSSYASIYPVGAPDDEYKSDLELDEVAPVFNKLLEALEPVEPEFQVELPVLRLLANEPGWDELEPTMNVEDYTAWVMEERRRLVRLLAPRFGLRELEG